MSGATLLRAGAVDEGRQAQAIPEKKPHVCFVAPYVWPVFSRDPDIKLVGGAEVQQSILARLFQRNGHPVSIVTLDFGQSQDAVVDGVRVRKTHRPDEGIPVLRFLHPRLSSTWAALREVNADIYYQRSAGMQTGVVAEFCRRHGKRFVFAGASDNDFERGKQQIRFRRDRWLYERGLAMADRVVVQNANQMKCLREQYGLEGLLIPSAYELPARTSPRDAADRVLWVATIHEYKRPEMVLEIAKRLPHRKFVMVGGVSTRGTKLKAGYYESIRDAAAQLPNVDFKGFLPLAQVEPWFDRARVFLNTSVYEGVPNTFMQAWARGVPTVASVDISARVDGKPLYDTFSQVEEAAGQVERLFEDQLAWARASARCFEYFNREHGGAEILRRYTELFESLTPAS